MRVTTIVAAFFALALLAGCGGQSAIRGDGPVPATPSATTQQPTPFMTTVSVTVFGPDCEKVKCWLPTQFQPRLVERESVSKYDAWPKDGDVVEVLCVTKGDTYLNQLGQPVNDWYGIRVPPDKVDPNAVSRAEKAPDGNGYVGYVGISWLAATENHAPACQT